MPKNKEHLKIRNFLIFAHLQYVCIMIFCLILGRDSDRGGVFGGQNGATGGQNGASSGMGAAGLGTSAARREIGPVGGTVIVLIFVSY